jgi:hypothetical protein
MPDANGIQKPVAQFDEIGETLDLRMESSDFLENPRLLRRSFRKMRVLTALLIVSFPAFAQLKWHEKRIEIFAKPGDAEVVTKFVFNNAGNKHINLLSVRTTCGCTVATPEKWTLQPEEKGAITVQFTLGDREGIQEKPITVKTDAPDVTELLLVVHIPSLLKFEPSYLSWPMHSGPSQSKTIHVTAASGAPIKIVDILPSDPKIQAQLHVIEPGRKYEIPVSLNDASQPFYGRVTVTTDFPKEKPKSYDIPILVEKSLGNAPLGIATVAIAVAMGFLARRYICRR